MVARGSEKPQTGDSELNHARSRHASTRAKVVAASTRPRLWARTGVTAVAVGRQLLVDGRHRTLRWVRYAPPSSSNEYQGSYIGEGVWNVQTRVEITREGDEYWQRDITL